MSQRNADLMQVSIPKAAVSVVLFYSFYQFNYLITYMYVQYKVHPEKENGVYYYQERVVGMFYSVALDFHFILRTR